MPEVVLSVLLMRESWEIDAGLSVVKMPRFLQHRLASITRENGKGMFRIAILLHWLGYQECLGILEKIWVGFLLLDKIISILMIGLSYQTEKLSTTSAPTDFTVLR